MKLRNFMAETLSLGDKGFTLLETMVAVGIGTIVTLGISSMVQNAARLKIEAEAQIERNQISLLFDSVLIDSENCALSILPSATDVPEKDPPPAGRLYTSDITNADIRRIEGLKRYDRDGDVQTVLSLSGLPGTPIRLGRSRIEITDVYLTNFKVINNVEIYDPNSAPGNFRERDKIKVPVSGSYDLVLKFNKITVGGNGEAGVHRKAYSVNKVVPIKIDQERPKDDDNVADDFNGKSYISGCRTGEDVSTAEVERFVCDSLGGGSEIRALTKNTDPDSTGPRWGPAGNQSAGYSYVDCKDIRRVRERMLKMLMCDELNGEWDPVDHKCNNQFIANGLDCPGAGTAVVGTRHQMVVYGIYNIPGLPGDPTPVAINANYEPLPSPPGDGILEVMECRPPCPRYENYPLLGDDYDNIECDSTYDN